MSGIGAQRGDLLQHNVEYHLQVTDVLERDGYGSTLGNGQLVVTIECGGSGYLKIGPALDALEEELIRRWNSSPPPDDSNWFEPHRRFMAPSTNERSRLSSAQGWSDR